MKWTINRIAVLAAGAVLAGILLILSISYFQEKALNSGTTSKEAVQEKISEKQERPKRPKLTEKEKEQALLEREAKRTGQSTEELQEAAKDPNEQIEREAERVKELSDDQARSELVRKKRQLEKMSEENVEEILKQVAPEEPKRETTVQREVSFEEFDADTAQIDDCERFTNEDGTFRYEATLVDAKGNSVKVDMHGAEGEQTYRTMKIIKGNPLMEAIYRRSVMPLLDQKASEKSEIEKTGEGKTEDGNFEEESSSAEKTPPEEKSELAKGEEKQNEAEDGEPVSDKEFEVFDSELE